MTIDKTGMNEMTIKVGNLSDLPSKSGNVSAFGNKRRKRESVHAFSERGYLELKASKKNAKGVVNHKSRLLLDWLTIQRPYGSQNEMDFTHMLYQKCGGQLGFDNVEQDGFGNVIATVDGESNVMFSAHTDTVHHDEGTQNVCVDLKKDFAFTSDGSCLGSDDATGCYILWRMIEAGVPGLYIFHRGEEVGGLGSDWLAEQRPEIFKSIDMAVAFDRRGTHDIITSQSGGVCASEEFAESLAGAFQLANPKLEYQGASGVFTDTANYTRLVAECTNISCGYYDEHTPSESQDLGHLEELIKACVVLPWNDLVVVRDTAGSLDELMVEATGIFDAGERLRTMVGLVQKYPAAAAALLIGSGVDEYDFYSLDFMDKEYPNIEACESDPEDDFLSDKANYLQEHVADLLEIEELREANKPLTLQAAQRNLRQTP